MPSSTTGVLWIHSAPLALQPHLNWAVARLRDPETSKAVRVNWRTQNIKHTPTHSSARDQPSLRTTVCAEIQFFASAADADTVADYLGRWPRLFFEMAIDADKAGGGKRICHTPELGTFRADTDAIGNVVLNENVIRSLMTRAAVNPSGETVEKALTDALDEALGGPWDRVLEPMRLITAGFQDCALAQQQLEFTQEQPEHEGSDDVVVRLYPRRAVM